LGQQTSSKEPSVAQLKELISKLEAVSRDAATPPEVKELNQRFLLQRRTQLRGLMQKAIEALRTYQTTIGSSLSSEERKVIEGSIGELTSDLAKLESDLQNGSPSAELAAEPAAAANANAGEIVARPEAVSEPAVAVNPNANAPLAQPLIASPAAPLQAQNPAPAPGCNLYEKNPKQFSFVDLYICSLAADIKERKLGNAARRRIANPVAGLDLPADYTRLFIVLSAKKGRAAELVIAEESRTDKQVGSDSASSGSTSLVSKGNVPAILGFAVENGALERDVTGTTITFRATPVGIFKSLAGQGLIGGYDTDDATTRFLRRFSFGVSFDANRGAEPGLFTGGKQQISSISARAVLYDKRDPRRAEYKKDWEDFLGREAMAFLQADVETRNLLIDINANTGATTWTDPALEGWFEDTQRALAAAAPANVETVLIDRLNKLPLDGLAPGTMSASPKFETALKLYIRARDAILKKGGNAGVLTFDYVNDRQVNSPDLSNFKLVGEKGFHNGRVDLTGNASLTIFNNKPATAGVGRVRDAQAALQFDGTFGSATETGMFVFSLAYKYKRMMENAQTFGGAVMPNTKGDISVGQIKLSIPIKGLGMKIPLSITFANRTELVKEKEVRGNIGFTFDLDSIFARFKPF
jgi:hypothetical protein